MALGENLRQARREAGLTQRQLSEGIVTRNMLSQIENGTARPSMDTLAALAARLRKPMGFFLDPDAPAPNQAALLAAWDHWEKKEYPQAAEALAGFTPPDALLGREYALLMCMVNLALGEAALAQGRDTLALSHFAQAALEEENAPRPCGAPPINAGGKARHCPYRYGARGFRLLCPGSAGAGIFCGFGQMA